MIDFSEKIKELRTLSKNVDLYVLNESWRLTYSNEEEISDQIILNECYLLIIYELQKIGIVFNTDDQTLLGDYYTADGVLYLKQLLDKNKLHDALKLHPEKLDNLRYIIESDELNEEEYFASFYEWMQLNFPDKKEYEYIERISDLIMSNLQFKIYITDLINDLSIPDAILNDIDDVNRICKYVKQIIDGRLIFEFVIKLIWDYTPDINKDYLQHSINLYDLEKVQPENISKYSWAVLNENNKDLNDSEKALLKRILNQHKTRNSHHIEYYTNRNLLPNTNNLVELVTHHAEIGTTKEKFLEDVNTMINDNYDPYFKENDNKEFAINVANKIVEKFYMIPDNYNKFNQQDDKQ